MPNESYIRWHVLWRHPAHTVEQLCATAVIRSATSGDDVACFQITLGKLFVVVDMLDYRNVEVRCQSDLNVTSVSARSDRQLPYCPGGHMCK